MDLVKTILGEYRIHNADITLRYDATAEDLIDVIEGNRVYIPCLYVLNKIDQISIEVRKWGIKEFLQNFGSKYWNFLLFFHNFCENTEILGNVTENLEILANCYWSKFP